MANINPVRDMYPETHVDVRCYDDGRKYKFETLKPMVFELDGDFCGPSITGFTIYDDTGGPLAQSLRLDDRLVIIRILEGYAWDGSSGPAIDTNDTRRGSGLHDFLYQSLRLGLLPPAWRRKADYLYWAVLRAREMNRLRAWWHWAGVRLGGRSSARLEAR